eukprot:SAG25_NODE_10166_length_344_cov_0.746939_1_plen_29_part_10
MPAAQCVGRQLAGDPQQSTTTAARARVCG